MSLVVDFGKFGHVYEMRSVDTIKYNGPTALGAAEIGLFCLEGLKVWYWYIYQEIQDKLKTYIGFVDSKTRQ